MAQATHLDRAKEYIAQGEDSYRKAAHEIVAAKNDDPQLTNRIIGEQLGKSADWVGRLVRWVTSDDPDRTPFEGTGNVGRAASAAKMVARERPTAIADAVKAAPAAAKREIAEALVEDKDFRRTTDEAMERRIDKRREAAKGRERETHAGLADLDQAYKVASALDSARYKVAEALRELSEMELDSERREMVRDHLTDLQNAVGWLASFLDTGDRSFDEALDRLLAEGV